MSIHDEYWQTIVQLDLYGVVAFVVAAAAAVRAFVRDALPRQVESGGIAPRSLAM